MTRTVLVAPAWPYANGPRHIGHVAGFAVPADVLARFERLSCVIMVRLPFPVPTEP
ncbi:MAG TPA: class I tRNA ligase family protein, partial [Patescibacteria group bacterium]|nr:class I tRNA ligase family protein [Patescibacteria group bacterium]